MAKFCAFPSPHWLQYNLLWELDSRLYHSQLIKMKVRYRETGREEKVSLQNCLFENGVNIKSPASGSCIYVAHALFLTYSFQENAAKVTGVNLFIWNREKYLNDYKCSSVYIYQMILILCGLCFMFSWESSVHRLIYQDFSRMVPKCNGNQMEFWYLTGIGARWHNVYVKINIVFEILWLWECFRNSFWENEHLKTVTGFQKEQKQP